VKQRRRMLKCDYLTVSKNPPASEEGEDLSVR